MELLSDQKYSDSHFILIDARTSIPENCSVVINKKKTTSGLFTWFSVILGGGEGMLTNGRHSVTSVLTVLDQ